MSLFFLHIFLMCNCFNSGFPVPKYTHVFLNWSLTQTCTSASLQKFSPLLGRRRVGHIEEQWSWGKSKKNDQENRFVLLTVLKKASASRLIWSTKVPKLCRKCSFPRCINSGVFVPFFLAVFALIKKYLRTFQLFKRFVQNFPTEIWIKLIPSLPVFFHQ